MVYIRIQENSIIIKFHLTFQDHCIHHVETSQMICSANQLTGFYILGNLNF